MSKAKAAAKKPAKQASTAPKTKKPALKGEVVVVEDNGLTGVRRRLSKTLKVEILRDYYLKGMNYSSIGRDRGVDQSTVRNIVISSTLLPEVKKELEKKARQQAERIMDAYGEQAVKTAGKAKGLQAVTGWGIAVDKVHPKPGTENKKEGDKTLQIVYTEWKPPVK